MRNSTRNTKLLKTPRNVCSALHSQRYRAPLQHARIARIDTLMNRPGMRMYISRTTSDRPLVDRSLGSARRLIRLSDGRTDRLTCSSLGQIEGGGAKVHGLAATLAVGGVNGDLVGGAGVQIADRKDGHFAGLVVDDGRGAALAGLAIHLHGELLRQPAVEALHALHVDRIGGLI